VDEVAFIELMASLVSPPIGETSQADDLA
jgi:hypothetical protein